PGVNHPLLTQLQKELSISREFCQYLFHLRYHMGLICERNLETYFWMNNITWTAKISHDWHSSARKSFEHYTCTIVTNGRKQEYIRRSHFIKDFCMAEPTGEVNSAVNAKCFHKLLKTPTLRSIADHRKPGH